MLCPVVKYPVMKRFEKIVISTFVFVALSSAPALADSYGYNGSTPVTSCLAIDKSVSNPASSNLKEFIDNVTVSSAKYKSGQTLMERAKIKNVSNRIVPNVRITSIVPQYIKYVSGPVSFNKGGTEFTINVGDLQPQEEKIFYITFAAKAESELPNQTLTIFTNTIRAQGDVCDSVEDTAQMIIERQVLGTTKGGQPIEELKDVKKYPNSGPEHGIALLAIQSALLGAGLYLKKHTS